MPPPSTRSVSTARSAPPLPATSWHSSRLAPLQRWWRQRRANILQHFPLRHASLSEGLRAACSAGTMLLAGEWLHNPLFSLAAVGAFLTCLADSAGSNRARLTSMGGFALASTLAGMFASSLSGLGLLPGLLAIMLCAAIAGLARIYGAATGLVLSVAAAVSAILAEFPVHAWPLQHSAFLVYFSGCAWATLLGLTVWRIHPFAPARHAVARVYATLAELARRAALDMHAGTDNSGQNDNHAAANAANRRHARNDLALARSALMRITAERADSRQLYEILLIKMARAEALLNGITMLADLRQAAYQQQALQLRCGRVLDGMALLLQEISRSTAAGGHDQHVQDAVLRMNRLIARLPARTADMLRPAESAGTSTIPPLPGYARRSYMHRARAAWSALVNLFETAAAHLQTGSAEVSHGLRCAAAVGSTYLLVHLLHLPFGYWATMATMLVMQPSIADSWTRSMERAAGSVIGGLLAVLLSLHIHSPLLLALLVFPMTALAMGLRPVSYGLYATFLTPVFVLTADVASDPRQQLGNALLRAGNNLLGVLIAIAASYLLWPRRQTINLHFSLSHMIEANLDYLLSALRGATPAQLHGHRRQACVSNNENSLLLQRLLREKGIDERLVQQARTSIALSRRLAAAATHIRLHAHGATASDALLQAWLEQMAALFRRHVTTAGSYPALLRQRPVLHDPARADAVETMCLLMLAMYPELAVQT